jgi:hypothetical protein
MTLGESQFLIKSNVILHSNRKNILIFVWNHKRPQIAKNISSKMNKLVTLHYRISNIYFKGIGIRTA